MRPYLVSLVAIALVILASPSHAEPCVIADGGSGTIALPPQCPAGYVGPMQIVDGLPPGTTMDIEASLRNFVVTMSGPGGALGGEFQQFDAELQWTLSGIGSLAGFNRTLFIPVSGKTESGPRTPGDPEQAFAIALTDLRGELFGDPDFCVLRVTAGSDNGLPSPGQTVLTELPSGEFNVDSFFDISYRIEFDACPGSPLDGYAGTTTGSDVLQAGEIYTPVYDHPCVMLDNGSGTIDLPPLCPDGYAGLMRIVDGLPPGCTLEIDAQLTEFANIVRVPGGTLGGQVQQFDATLRWLVTGGGCMAGFNRTMFIPVSGVFHTAPPNSGDPLQLIPSVLHALEGELFGDPDFCTLRVRAGGAFGLPSPGETDLVELPSGDFAVDSFFDVTYEIEFEGCPGAPLDGLTGTTTDTDRFHAGGPFHTEKCVLPDNGTGTVDLPLECPEGYAGPMTIVDGLPPGCWIDIDAEFLDFQSIVRSAGGSLGGQIQSFQARLVWVLTGGGCMAGFNRSMSVPVVVETHSAPTSPGDHIQQFAQEFYSLQGELFGDPDFCTLRVRAGIDFGLPSPGQTTLVRQYDGSFAVDSFFDITYEIEFEGCPGGALDGLAGTTRDTERFFTGGPIVTASPPSSSAGFALLHQNEPNPFNPSTVIRYELGVAGPVRLTVHDARGRLVRVLANEVQASGPQEQIWNGRSDDGRRAASGIYFYQLRTRQGVLHRKMALIK